MNSFDEQEVLDLRQSVKQLKRKIIKHKKDIEFLKDIIIMIGICDIICLVLVILMILTWGVK